MPEFVTRPVAPADPHADSAFSVGDAPTGSSSLPSALPPPTPPVLPSIPGYDVLEELGRGGMGVVYKARHLQLNRVVALKMILAGAYAGPDEVARLRQEAAALGRLQHPNIVQIFEVGEVAGTPFFALEYVEGGALDRKLDGAPQPPREAAALVEALARAVHAAHQRRVVHRDLKPQNILLAADGTPKITDFGLAKRLDEEGRTASGAVLGTPAYMAPEQARGKPGEIGPAADVYALGVILYQMLTGRTPFRGDTAVDVVLQVLTADPPAPRQLRPDVPRDLETICLTCLHKEARRRYATAGALADDLRRFLDHRPVAVRRVGAVERLALWAQRRPEAASAAGLLVLTAALGVGGGAAVWSWRGAEQARGEAVGALNVAETEKGNANRARDEAEDAKKKAEAAKGDAEDARGKAVIAQQAEKKAREELARVSSFRQVDLAYHEWAAHRLIRADSLLDECPPELHGWEWRHVKRLCHPELAAWKTADGEVRAAAFSPDGKSLVIARKGAVDLCEASTGRVVRTLEDAAGVADESGIRVAFRADGKQVVGASPSGGAVWNAETGRAAGRPRWPGGTARDLALSPDGRLLALLSWAEDAAPRPGRPINPEDDEKRTQTVQIWDVRPGSKVAAATVDAGWGEFSTLVFSPDGKRLACRGLGTTRLWDAETGKSYGEEIGRRGDPRCVAFSPDGAVVACGNDHDILLVDAASGAVRATLRGHAGDATDVVFSPDGTRLASASSYDLTVRLWDVKAGREIRVLGGHPRASGLVFRPDGKRLLSFGDNGTVKVWDATADEETVRTRKGEWVFDGHTQEVRAVAFSPDGASLASGSRDGTARTWDVETCRMLRSLPFEPGNGREVVAVAFRPDGKRLAAASGYDGFRVWDAETGRVIVSTGRTDAFGVTDLAYSPDGARLVASVSDKVQVWDADTGHLLRSLADDGDDSKDSFMSAAFSPDGKRVAAGSYGKVCVWDAETGKVLRVLTGQSPGSPTYAAYSADGKFLAASDGWTVRVWDAESGREVRALDGHSSTVEAVAFSPDGRRLVSAGADWTVQLWDLETGREALTLTGHTGTVWRVRFSPDGDRLLSASEDGTVRLWDARPLDAGPASH